MTKATKPSRTIRANKRKAKLKAKHRRQRARATGEAAGPIIAAGRQRTPEADQLPL